MFTNYKGKNSLRILFMVMAVIMVFSSTIVANAQEASSDNFQFITPITQDNSLNYTDIANTIGNYFKYYYQSLEKKNLLDKLNEYVSDTDETHLYLKALQYNINWRKELNLGIKESSVSHIDIKYAKTTPDNNIDVKAYIKISYKYVEDPTNTQAGVGDLWDIILKNNNGSLKIISLNSESNDYYYAKELTKSKKEEMTKTGKKYSEINAIDDAYAEINSKIGDLKELVSTTSISKNESEEVTYVSEEEKLEVPISIQSVSVAYNNVNARIYANIKGFDYDTYVFKRAPESEGDCTNFISQCLWIGYGGNKGNSYNSEPGLSACQKLALDNFRQISGSNNWFGRSWDSAYDFPTGPWMRVIELYDYITSTSAGPRGKKYNNLKKYSESTTILKEGDIIQFSPSADASDYFHSVMVVTGGYSMKDGAAKMYVAHHSPETGYRQLSEDIASYGPYARIIRPTTGSFPS